MGAGVSFILVYLRDVRARPVRIGVSGTQKPDARRALIYWTKPDLRTSVANAVDYHGEEMSARLADIRNVADAVQLHAAKSNTAISQSA